MKANKEKKEAERLAKLAEKEEVEKEGKSKGKRKKKVDSGDQVRGSSTVDQGSQMESGSRSGVKRKAVLQELTKDMVTQGTQVIVIGDDQKVNTEELILNNSIVDVMENDYCRSVELLHS